MYWFKVAVSWVTGLFILFLLLEGSASIVVSYLMESANPIYQLMATFGILIGTFAIFAWAHTGDRP